MTHAPFRISRQIRPSLSTKSAHRCNCQQVSCSKSRTAVGRTDVGVVDLGEEPDLGRGHGILFGEEELQLEMAAWNLNT